MRHFLSSRTAPAQTLTLAKTPDHDAPFRRAWNMTSAEWTALSNTDRAYYRDHVTSAPMFAGK